MLTTERELALQKENVLGLDHTLVASYLRKFRERFGSALAAGVAFFGNVNTLGADAGELTEVSFKLHRAIH